MHASIRPTRLKMSVHSDSHVQFWADEGVQCVMIDMGLLPAPVVALLKQAAKECPDA